MSFRTVLHWIHKHISRSLCPVDWVSRDFVQTSRLMTVILLVDVLWAAESRSEQNCRAYWISAIRGGSLGVFPRVVPNVPSLWGATWMSLIHQGQLSLVARLVRCRSGHLGYRQWSVVQLTLYEWCTRCTLRSQRIRVTPWLSKSFGRRNDSIPILIWVLANVRHSWFWLIGSPPCIEVWMKVNSHVLSNSILSLKYFGWVKLGSRISRAYCFKDNLWNLGFKKAKTFIQIMLFT